MILRTHRSAASFAEIAHEIVEVTDDAPVAEAGDDDTQLAVAAAASAFAVAIEIIGEHPGHLLHHNHLAIYITAFVALLVLVVLLLIVR